MSNLPLFPTSVVGSLPRPDAVRALLGQDDSQAQLDTAIRDAVALQENAGIDILTDGEWRRASYIGVIAQLAHGFELATNLADGRPWTIVVDKLAPRNPGFTAAEVRYLKRITDRQIKATLPAPALLGERMWDAGKSSAAYSRPSHLLPTASPSCAAKLNSCARKALLWFKLMTRTFACSSIPRSAQNMTTPTMPRTSVSTWSTRS